MSRKDLRIERIAPAERAGGAGQALQPRRWGQLGYLVVGAARDLRRNRLTTSATLLLLSLSLALYGAVVLASQQLQLVAPSSPTPGAIPEPWPIPGSSSYRCCGFSAGRPASSPQRWALPAW
jgi:hypothetical protein